MSTFKIGTEHTITAGTASASGGGTISYEFSHLVGGVEVASTAAYTYDGDDNELAANARWRAVETGGTNPGATGWQIVGSGTVTYPAPTVTASDSLAGRTLTISVDSINHGATASLTSLTLDGVDVLGDASGSGPWEYVVPSAAASQTVAWEVTASNTGGTDTASGSEVVAADLTAPSFTTQPTLDQASYDVGDTVTLTEGAASGNPAPTLSITRFELDGVDKSGELAGLTWDTTGEAAGTISYEVTASNSVDSVVSDTITATLSLDATSPVINSATWTPATQTLTVNVTEVGPDPDTVDIYVVSYDGAEPSDAEVKAGTGGSIIEAYDAQDTTGLTDQDLGFTTASAGSNNIKVYVEDDAGNSDSTTVAASIEFVPDAFEDADWSVATGATTGGQLDVTIASLPAANGSTITDVEYELDASGTWTSSGGTSDFTITGLTASTSYDVRLRAVNEQGEAVASNTETAMSSAAGASQNFVDNGGSAFLTKSPAGAKGWQWTASLWINFNAIPASTANFFEIGKSDLRIEADGALTVYIRSNTSATYEATSSNFTFSTGQVYHVYIYADKDQTGANGLIVQIDGADITMNPAVSTYAVTGNDLEMDEQWTILSDGVDCKIADVFVDNSFVPNSSLYNGGTPPDLSQLTTPRLLLTGTASDYNAGANEGDDPGILTATGTFTDA